MGVGDIGALPSRSGIHIQSAVVGVCRRSRRRKRQRGLLLGSVLAERNRTSERTRHRIARDHSLRAGHGHDAVHRGSAGIANSVREDHVVRRHVDVQLDGHGRKGKWAARGERGPGRGKYDDSAIGGACWFECGAAVESSWDGIDKHCYVGRGPGSWQFHWGRGASWAQCVRADRLDFGHECAMQRWKEWAWQSDGVCEHEQWCGQCQWGVLDRPMDYQRCDAVEWGIEWLDDGDSAGGENGPGFLVRKIKTRPDFC